MVNYYTIFGRQIGSHYLAMATLTTIFGGAYLATGGSKSSNKAAQTPPINASSPDEADFIKKFLESAENEKKAEH